MPYQATWLRRFTGVFDPDQAQVLAEAISDIYGELARARDIRELKRVVQELAEAQKRTEVRVARMEELAEAQKRTEVRVEELAEAQKRTEVRVEELAEAQKRTEVRVEELAEAQKRTEVRVEGLAARMEELAEAQKRTEQRVEELAEAQKRTEQRLEGLAQAQEAMAQALASLARAQEESQRQIQALARAQEESQRQIQELTRQMVEVRRELGGLGRSMGYALENEAYRMLPAFLAEKHGIQVTERFVRTYIGDEEINLFGRGRRDGKEVLIVGEVKVRLEEGRREDALEQLEEKARVVQEAYPGEELLLLLVTHHAHPGILQRAQERGILVVQSFEW
jgi:chemotaxis protein histidine kinase CheA